MVAKDAIQFLHGVRVELSKVVWPKFNEFVGSTVVVLLLILAAAIYLGAVDLVLHKMAKYIFKYYSAY